MHNMLKRAQAVTTVQCMYGGTKSGMSVAWACLQAAVGQEEGVHIHAAK